MISTGHHRLRKVQERKTIPGLTVEGYHASQIGERWS